MVVWTGPAKQDLKRIFDFIDNDSRYYAEDVTGRIVELSVGLDVFPGKGRLVPEKADPDVREIFVYSYRVIYRIKPDSTYVLAVIHMSQDLTEDMLKL